jgi:hypothetical protein
MSATNRDVREIVREETFMRSRILEVLADGPLTIPQIAAALDCPTHEAVFWVMGMRRYGQVRDVKEPAVDGYFRYQALSQEPRS